MIAVYFEYKTKPINTLCGKNYQEGGTYSYNWILNG